MTLESDAHPEYQRRITGAEKTVGSKLFGFNWPLRHRMIPNAATRRWCRGDGTAKALPAAPAPLFTSLAPRISESFRPDRRSRIGRRGRLFHQRQREPVPVLGTDRLEHCGIKVRMPAHDLQRLSRCPHNLVGVR